MFEIQDIFARVFRFALSVTRNREQAEDISQECLLRALAKNVIENTDSSWQWCDPSKNIGWLFKVARNIWLDRIKSAEFRLKSEQNVDHLTEEFGECRLEVEEEIQFAMSQMMELPATQRQVLYLRAVEELSIEEISSAMDMNRGTVKTNLSLARSKMRDRLQKKTEAN